MRMLWWERHKEFEFLLEKAKNKKKYQRAKEAQIISKEAEGIPGWVDTLMDGSADNTSNEAFAVTQSLRSKSPGISKKSLAENAMSAGWSLHETTSVAWAAGNATAERLSPGLPRSRGSSVSSISLMPHSRRSSFADGDNPDTQFANVRKSLDDLLADSDSDNESGSENYSGNE